MRLRFRQRKAQWSNFHYLDEFFNWHITYHSIRRWYGSAICSLLHYVSLALIFSQRVSRENARHLDDAAFWDWHCNDSGTGGPRYSRNRLFFYPVPHDRLRGRRLIHDSFRFDGAYGQKNHASHD